MFQSLSMRNNSRTNVLADLNINYHNNYDKINYMQQ